MTVTKQDPDTGAIYPNGAVGRLLERVGWWTTRLLLPVLFLFTPPLIYYSFTHYATHALIGEFMEEGPRFAGTQELRDASALLSEVEIKILRELRRHKEAGAHPGVEETLGSLEKRLDNIQETQAEILRELRRR